MIIKVENNISTLVEYTEDEWKWVYDYLTIHEPKFRKNYRTKRTEHMGTIPHRLLNRSKMTFPAGFTFMIYHAAKREGIKVSYVDGRQECEVKPIDVDISYLRKYQQEAVEIILKRKRGIIKHATGAGKSIVAIALIQKVPIHWLFLCQSKDLLRQFADKYKQFTGEEASIIGDNEVTLLENSKLTIATAQTINSRITDKRIQNIIYTTQGLITEECHGSAADTMFRVILRAKNAYYKVGLSATPKGRTDHKNMYIIGAIGPVIHEVTADELIKAGYISKPKIEMHVCEQECSAPNYQGAYGQLVIRSTKRNKLIVDLMKKATYPNLTFVKQKNHGRELQKRAEKAGINVEFVWGGKNTQQRQAALKRLVRGDIDSIICTVIFTQGIDIPELRSIVVAAAGKSDIQTLQRLGRGSRTTEDKQTFELFDILDRENKWTQNHANKRKAAYRKEKYEVTVF